MSGKSGRSFYRLEIYRRYEELSDVLWTLIESWATRHQSIIGDQLLRAADSIGANIAESIGRGHFKDSVRFLYIARGSMNETVHWIRRAVSRGLINAKQAETLRPLCSLLQKQLNAFIRAQEPRPKNGQTISVQEDAPLYAPHASRKKKRKLPRATSHELRANA